MSVAACPLTPVTRSSHAALVVCRELEELEEEEAHFGVELVAMAPFASDEADEEKVKPWRLERVPAALAKELQQYVDYRSSPVSVLFASPRARLDELTSVFRFCS